MTAPVDFTRLPTTTLADVCGRGQVMDFGIKPMWQGMPRMAGPAFTVRCPAGDHLMFHAAIYRAPAGSIIVAESPNCDYALAGGNVCAIAQRRGIAGFVIDGVIRDIAEIRERRFPVVARGIIPFPGGKEHLDTLNDRPVRCGGVMVYPGDIVVADEDGVVVVPREQAESVYLRASERAEKEASEGLDGWEAAHREKVEAILKKKGFT